MAVTLEEAFHGKNQGWPVVYLPSMYYNYDDMVTWLTDNCTGRVRFHAAAFVFEDDRDATIFMFNRATWNYIEYD